MAWDGTGREVMESDEVAFDRTGRDGIGRNGMGWDANRQEVRGSDGMGYGGTGWHGMGRDGK